MLTTSVLLTLASLVAADVEMKFIEEGVVAKVGGYRPQRAPLQDESEEKFVLPPEVSNPRYGEIQFGTKSWAFVLDEPAEGAARLFVDTNQNRNLTDDPPAEWSAVPSGQFTMHRGTALLNLGDDRTGQIKLYRFDPNDPRRAQLKNTLLYYADFGYQVNVQIDDEQYTSFVAGSPKAGDVLWIDRDGNGKRSYKKETVTLGEPFNFTGTTYVMDVANGQMTLQPADTEIPQTPLPPDLSVGKLALPFQMEALGGETIRFPVDYKGKLVMLDFWATWCGPCIAELPNVKAAYEDWHEQGFEILGISFDYEGQADKVREFIRERDMQWEQLYEGKGWDTSLGDQYDVSSIPFVLLVDGDTGKIVATTADLRGPKLSETIGKLLKEYGKLSE